MKKAFGLTEILITVVIILLVFFMCFNKGVNPIKKYADEQVQLKNEENAINEQLNDISNVRAKQLEEQQRLIDEVNR